MLGFSIIFHLHKLDLEELRELEALNDRRATRKVELPSGLQNNLKIAQIILDEVHLWSY